jgi:UDP-glucose 4-epimerase
VNVLVTGGAGFIGSALVDRLLAEGHHVEVVDDLSTGSLANLASARAEGSGRLKIHQCDVVDTAMTDLVVRRAPDLVFHLAAPTDRRLPHDNAALAAAEVIGTIRLLDGAVAAGVGKVVAAGSARAHVVSSVPAAIRRTATDLFERYREAHGLQYTVVDLPTVYGPRQRPGCEGSLVATFADRLVHRRPCVVHGSGEQTRDLLYVDDAVDAFDKAASAGAGLRIAIGTGVQTSVRNLHRAMVAIVGPDDEPEVVPGASRPDEPGAVPVDPSRARMYLGWEPFTPLAEGLADTLVAVRP